MFFIHTMGRRSASQEADTLCDLGVIVDSAMKSQANNAIVVSVGRDDSAVMPYAWIRRNEDDEWEGELGDCIRLGIEVGSLIEHDPIQMMGLDDAFPKPKKSTNEDMAKEAERMVKDLFKSIREE